MSSIAAEGAFTMSLRFWKSAGISFLLSAILSSLSACGGSGSSTSSGTPPANPIQNIVIIFQENRTPDNLFQGLCITPYGSPSACSTTPSATQFNIQTSNWLNNQSSTGSTQPGVIDLGTAIGGANNPDNYDLSHAHTAFLDMCDLNTTTNTCAMDGAAAVTCGASSGYSCPTDPQYFYVAPADVAPYLQMAQTYAFADQMFQTNQGPSFPAHQFLLAGTSSPTEGSSLFVSENATGIKSAGANTGCTAPAAEYVEEITPQGVEDQTTFPCMEHTTITDLLDAANLTWRYYSPSLGSLWDAPSAINHMCQPNGALGSATACDGPDFTAANPKVVLNQSQTNAQILTDIASNQLQNVSWVIPTGADSDHALSNDGCGPSWVTSIVNAIGASPYWSNTAIIITWDDWGGWYDHVPPPQVIDDGTSWGSGYVYGFRVPMIVISPYSKPAYISHTTHDFGSILKFIETNYGLGSLGTADVNADDLSDIFQTTHAPVAFTQITPPTNNATCLADPTGPTDPDND